MNEVYSQAISTVLGVWRRRWQVIVFAWLFCGAGWAVVASMPDRYESSARIYVDMDTMLGPLMRGLAVERNLYQQISIMQRTLLSRPNLEKVILMTDMDLSIGDDLEKERVIDSLAKKISIVQQGRKLNLFKVSYFDKDPVLAKRVVQAVLQIFVEGNIGANRKDIDATRRFIDNQIVQYERQLDEAEDKLAEFKRKNMGFLPGEGNYYTAMQRMRDKVRASKSQLGEAVSQNEELRKQLETIPQFTDGGRGQFSASGSAGPGSEIMIQTQIIEIESLIAGLKTRYTDRHPDVLTAQRRLEALQKELAEEQKVLSGGDGPSASGSNENRTRVPNPVYEQLKVTLIQQDADIAALMQRVEEQKRQVDKWERMANLVPKVEAQLVRLTRDYQIVKRNYEQLRNRKESAKLASELETKAQKVQFRIIDPPKVPLRPSGPNRPLFMSVVLFGGILGGAGFAFLLGQINTTFADLESLKKKFSLPVLGSITTITSLTEQRRLRRELAGFSLVSISLLLAFTALMALQILSAKGVIAAVAEFGSR